MFPVQLIRAQTINAVELAVSQKLSIVFSALSSVPRLTALHLLPAIKKFLTINTLSIAIHFQFYRTTGYLESLRTYVHAQTIKIYNPHNTDLTFLPSFAR